MKKMMTFVMSMVLMLTLIPSVGAEAAKNSGINTPAEYINYLEAKAGAKSKLSGVGSVNSAQSTDEFIEEFKNLSEEKQQKFVDYLNDPEFLKTLVNAQSTSENKSQSFYGGDLVVSNEVVDVPQFLNASSKGDFSTNAVGDSVIYAKAATATSTLFGLDFIKTRVDMSIQVTEVQLYTSKVTKILSYSGSLIQNYLPGATISKTVLIPYIVPDSTAAVHKVDWEWKFTLGYDLTIGTKEQYLTIDKAGNTDTGIYNL